MIKNLIKEYSKAVGCFLIIVIVLIPNLSFAADKCSKDGYTIVTINGINTDETGARVNMTAVRDNLGFSYQGQNINYQYLYNKSHGIVIDSLDTTNQIYFNENSLNIQDSDFAQMLTDASAKLTTQKVLLVSHSQGNFYANTFYDAVADESGGVPSQSIGVYGVANPSNHVAGNGNYLTSDTDKMVAKFVAKFPFAGILKPNVHIAFQNSDSDLLGHDFTKIYLKYQGARIVSDIQFSLNKLKTNNIQNVSALCINPPKLTLTQKIQDKVFALVDPISIPVQTLAVNTIVGSYQIASAIGNSVLSGVSIIAKSVSYLALSFFNNNKTLAENNPASVIFTTAINTTVLVPKKESISLKAKTTKDIPPYTPQNTKVSVSNNIPIVVPVISAIPISTASFAVALHGSTAGVSIPLTENVLSQVGEILPVASPVDETPILNTFIIDKDTTLTAGEYNYDNLIITNNAVLTLESDPASSNNFKGVKINAVNITIDVGSSISADGKGYGPNQGPGAMADISDISNTGASYGGISYGNPNGITYGSATKPVDLGSGGTTNGGGSIRIIVFNTFTNNGFVSSNGNVSSSGGSIYVTVKNIVGDGKFSANGGGLYAGNYFKSPGGGGRIAIYYKNSLFNGTVETKGGCGQYDGMTMSCSQNGTVGLFDESVNNFYANASWRFQKNDSPFNLNNIFLTNSQVSTEDGIEITANNITLDKISTLTLSGGEIINANSISLLGNSNITVNPEKILYLKVSNLNIENGSIISADGKGYTNGPGTPDTFYEAGASYGGMGGGVAAKPVYGSEEFPVDFGSGTESHRGGGAIRLVIDNFKNDGTVSASGIYQRVSGGSIYVNADKVSGSGVFQASGGNSEWPYGLIGGGGGRIAIYYKTSTFIEATLNVLGGIYCYSGCSPAGSVGTFKIIDESIPVPVIIPDPILDHEPDPDIIPL